MSDPDESAGGLTGIRTRLEEGMDRREFLRTVVTGGYALGMAQFLGVEDLLSADDGEVPVVTALVRPNPEDPWTVEERTKAVPEQWYAAVTKAIEMNERLAQASITGYLGSAVVPGPYEDPGATITVGASTRDLDRVSDVVGEILEGVSYEVDAIEEIGALDEDRGRIDPVVLENPRRRRLPGGVICGTEKSVATLTPALYDPDERRRYFATAQHAYGQHDDPMGQTLTVPFVDGKEAPIGRVRHEHPVEDLVAVTPTGSYTPDSAIGGPVDERVNGQLTRFGLADLLARGEPLEKVSAMTGHTTGHIQGIDAVTCLTEEYCRRGQLRWGSELDMTDGDSGSVSYYPDPERDGVLVAGLNNARTWWPGQNYVWGTAAYRLTDEYGYYF
ncbi:hypothetical protein ACYJ1Y_09290 [Natrialbaceae archaeon A-gly3]